MRAADRDAGLDGSAVHSALCGDSGGVLSLGLREMVGLSRSGGVGLRVRRVLRLILRRIGGLGLLLWLRRVTVSGVETHGEQRKGTAEMDRAKALDDENREKEHNESRCVTSSEWKRWCVREREEEEVRLRRWPR